MSEWTVHPAATLFPLLKGADFEALVADIREHGLREAIRLDRDGRILDGRNRIRACEAAGVEPRCQTYEGDDPLEFVISLNLVRRHLDESQTAMVAARMANLEPGRPSEKAQICAVTQVEAAERTRVSRRTVQHAAKVLADGAEELVAAVDQGLVAVSDAASVAKESHTTQRALVGAVQREEVNNLKTAKVRRDIERQRLEIAEGRTVQPEGVFEVIAVDPPWPYETAESYDAHGFRGGTPYPEISLEELAVLQLPAAQDCILWLWTTHRFLPDAFAFLRAWGFEHKMVLTWVKNRFGNGRWLRSKSEFCIMAVKGSPKVDLTNQTTIIDAPMREHSRKPDEFYALVDSLCVGRKLDYFSREKRPGWAQYGNETAKFGGAA